MQAKEYSASQLNIKPIRLFIECNKYALSSLAGVETN